MRGGFENYNRDNYIHRYVGYLNIQHISYYVLTEHLRLHNQNIYVSAQYTWI